MFSLLKIKLDKIDLIDIQDIQDILIKSDPLLGESNII